MWRILLSVLGLLASVASQETSQAIGHPLLPYTGTADIPGPFTLVDTSVSSLPSGRITVMQFFLKTRENFHFQVWRPILSPFTMRFRLVHDEVISGDLGGFLRPFDLEVEAGDRVGFTFDSTEPPINYEVVSTFSNPTLYHQAGSLPVQGDSLTINQTSQFKFAWMALVQSGEDPATEEATGHLIFAGSSGREALSDSHLPGGQLSGGQLGQGFDDHLLRKRRGVSVTVTPEPSQGAQYFGSNIENMGSVDSGSAQFSYIDGQNPLVSGVAVRFHFHNSVASKVVRLQIWRLQDDPSTSGTDFTLVFEETFSSSSIGQQQVPVSFVVQQGDVLGFTNPDGTQGTISYEQVSGFRGYTRSGLPVLGDNYEFTPTNKRYAIGLVVATSSVTTDAPVVTPPAPEGGAYVGNPLRRRAETQASDARFAYVDDAESNRLPKGRVVRLLYYTSSAGTELSLQIWRRVSPTSSMFGLVHEQPTTSSSGLNSVNVNWNVEMGDVIGFTNVRSAADIDYDQDSTNYRGFQVAIATGTPSIGQQLAFQPQLTKTYSIGVHIIPDPSTTPTSAPVEAVRITNQLIKRDGLDTLGAARYTYIDGSFSKILPTGKLVKFLLYVEKAHVAIQLQIWRLDQSEILRFRLVHQTQYTPTEQGAQEVDVDFNVLNGDRIGFTNPGADGPIPYDTSSNYAGLQRSTPVGQSFDVGLTKLEFTEKVTKLFSFGVEVIPDPVDCTDNSTALNLTATGLDLIGNAVEARLGTLQEGARRTFLHLDIIMRVGVVTGYLLYVNVYNPVRIQIWRPATQDPLVDKKFELIHEKRVTPNTIGYLQVKLDSSEYFYTKFGDRLGFTNEQDVGPIAFSFNADIYNPLYFYTFPGTDYPIIGDVHTFNNLRIVYQFSIAAYFNSNPCEVLPIPDFVTTPAPTTTRATTPAPIPGPPGPKGDAGSPGADGVPGTNGADGQPGATGAKGDSGPPGLPGLAGADGADGVKGAKGDIGEKGATGANGLDGTPGTNGNKGAKGDTGGNGVKGDKGEQGIQGIQGPAGTQGGVGVKGEQGDKGIQGDIGAKGEKGSVGEVGLKGETGDQGLAGSKGEKGAIGETGLTGQRGPDGDAGAQGPDGQAGPQGPAGDKGAKGELGEIGPSGEIGVKGISGDKGSKGSGGDKGAKGEGGVGVTGPQGEMGIAGPPGNQGPIGTKGLKGEQGSRGIPGPPGQSKVFAVWGVHVGNEVITRPQVYGSANRKKRQAIPAEGGYIDVEAVHMLPRGTIKAFTFYAVRTNLNIYMQVYRPNPNDAATMTLVAEREFTPTAQGVFTRTLENEIEVELGDYLGFYNPHSVGIIPYQEEAGTFAYNTVRRRVSVGDAVTVEQATIKKYSFAALVDADNDECAGISGCTQQCRNTYGSYVCECNAGYQLDSDQKTCLDVDECAVNNGLCESTCSNSLGSYTCSCPQGFSLGANAHQCIDTDECAVNKGGCSDICVNTHGSFSCDCPKGYSLNGLVCEDIDECSSGSHLCEGTCTNTQGSYTCSCGSGQTLSANGYYCTGSSGNLGTDFCLQQNCNSGQTCISSTAGATCINEFDGSNVQAVTSDDSLLSDTVIIALLVWLAVLTLILLALLLWLCLRRDRTRQPRGANYDWSRYDDNAFSTTPYAQEKPASSFVYPQYPEVSSGTTPRSPSGVNITDE